MPKWQSSTRESQFLLGYCDLAFYKTIGNSRGNLIYSDQFTNEKKKKAHKTYGHHWNVPSSFWSLQRDILSWQEKEEQKPNSIQPLQRLAQLAPTSPPLSFHLFAKRKQANVNTTSNKVKTKKLCSSNRGKKLTGKCGQVVTFLSCFFLFRIFQSWSSEIIFSSIALGSC